MSQLDDMGLVDGSNVEAITLFVLSKLSRDEVASFDMDQEGCLTRVVELCRQYTALDYEEKVHWMTQVFVRGYVEQAARVFYEGLGR